MSLSLVYSETNTVFKCVYSPTDQVKLVCIDKNNVIIISLNSSRRVKGFCSCDLISKRQNQMRFVIQKTKPKCNHKEIRNGQPNPELPVVAGVMWGQKVYLLPQKRTAPQLQNTLHRALDLTTSLLRNHLTPFPTHFLFTLSLPSHPLQNAFSLPPNTSPSPLCCPSVHTNQWRIGAPLIDAQQLGLWVQHHSTARDP